MAAEAQDKIDVLEAENAQLATRIVKYIRVIEGKMTACPQCDVNLQVQLAEDGQLHACLIA